MMYILRLLLYLKEMRSAGIVPKHNAIYLLWISGKYRASVYISIKYAIIPKIKKIKMGKFLFIEVNPFSR